MYINTLHNQHTDIIEYTVQNKIWSVHVPSATVQCLGVIHPLDMVVDRSELRVMGVASTISCTVMPIVR